MPPQFEAALRDSQSQETREWWEPHYKAAWPDILFPLHVYEHNPSNIDVVALKGRPPHGIRIDEKRVLKSYDTLALELHHEKPDGKRWLGWARCREKYTSIDVFFYGVVPDNVSYVLPAQRLLALEDDELKAFEEIGLRPGRNGGKRRQKVWNKPRANGMGGYWTDNLIVHPDEILPLIGGRAVNPYRAG